MEPARMTAEQKETLLKTYHPDYREDQFSTLKVGPNKGDKVPHELCAMLEAHSRITADSVDLTKPDYDVDVLVIGGGGAGTSAAIEAHEAGANVMIVTKLRMGDANTMMAEGGIQAADKPNDSPAIHFVDAFGGGHFAAKRDLLAKLVCDAPEAIQWLSNLGVEFDKEADGTMVTTHGGGTSRKRMHAAKDYSGAEIMRTLRDEVLNRGIPVVDFTSAIELILDDKGRAVKSAGPSMAVSILGLEDVPNAGDSIMAVDQSLMKQVQEERKNRERENMIKEQSRVSLDDIFAQVEEGKIKNLNLIVKGDVQGSVEAVKQSLEKLTNEEVRVKVIHAAAGAINEGDVMLADSANAIIIGFNVRPDTKAKKLAESSKVDVRSYRIIYELLDDMEAALKGMLAPKLKEVLTGKCEVRQTFNITGAGTIAGCYVTDGKIIRGGKLRIYREDIMICEGGVKQLKRFKDDVREVNYGYECGCAIEGFNEIRVGDIIECYVTEEIKA